MVRQPQPTARCAFVVDVPISHTIFLVKVLVRDLKVTTAQMIPVPQICESSYEWPWNGPQGRCQMLIKCEKNIKNKTVASQNQP